MIEALDHLKTALADRYTTEREIGCQFTGPAGLVALAHRGVRWGRKGEVNLQPPVLGFGALHPF